MLFGSVAGGGGSFAITGVSGTKSHDSSIVISGAQFGTKSTPGPVIYDDASGTSPSATGWDEASPNVAPAAYNTAYRTLPTTNGSVSALPHSHITKAICGCHHGSGAHAGQSVHLEMFRTVSSYPAYTFFSCWIRMDDNFVFDGTTDNFKFYDWGQGNGGYNLDANWYTEGGNGGNTWGSQHTASESTWWHFNSDSIDPPGPHAPRIDPDMNGHNEHWDSFASPFTAWRKHEYLVKWQTNNTGYIKIWDGGVLRANYLGPTDVTTGSWAGTDRYDMIGGYSDERSVNNWRYYCDVYYDQTPSRVILGNASTIGSCTIKEPQICTAWSSTSITCTMKHGAIPTGSAWLYVFDSDNNSTAGFAVTLV